MNLQPLPTNCSKADEIALLEKITKLATPGTFLADLLSPTLVSWFRHQLAGDVSTDIMDVVNHLRCEWNKAVAHEHELYLNTEKDKTALCNEINGLRDELQKAREETVTFSKALRAEQALTLDARSAADDAQMEVDDLREELHNLELKLEEDLAAKQAEINTLKARLFDLGQTASK